QWFNLSDPAAEESLYDSAAMRAFVGIDLGNAPAPDETTICRFRSRTRRDARLERAVHGPGLRRASSPSFWATSSSRVRVVQVLPSQATCHPQTRPSPAS
ncbi:MAG: transposase, partial [Vulcanimicrobiaceae bacterium]